ncbi:fibronectin type III domain-containing protein [Paenibacillus sanfengchensis]|uniref:fibronectin type III domain-containing protein n=1 Tax=Paenibacillus sanfengchensis TaxID=3119819 RepID=UPI002FE2B390
MKRLSWIFSLLLFVSTLAVPSTTLAKSSIDIVFVIDRSGSMASSINAVKDNVAAFADMLAARGISYRLGLVSYEETSTRYAFTSDVNTFKAQLGKISVDGGTENGLDAIMNAAQYYPFDVNASKYFILIGDEVVTSDQGYTVPSVIQYMNSMKIKLTTIGIDEIKSQFKQLSDQTGGMYLDLYSNFSTSLTRIFEQIQRIPTLEIINPSSGQMLSDLNTAFIPSVKVTDPDSDTLQLAYYVDSETVPRDKKTVSNTMTAQTVSFNALNIGTLSEGNHTFRFTVYDGSDTVQDTVTVKVDKSVPTLGTIRTAATATTIQISGSATDSGSGLSTAPYRYTVGSLPSSWTSATTFTHSNLVPNTAYTVVFEARDAAGHIAQKIETVWTKGQVPILGREQASETSAVLSLQDSNPASTFYQVRSGALYVSGTGTLTTAPSWIMPTNKKITVTGLTSNTEYSFQAKARNQNSEETDFGATLSLSTLAAPPAASAITSNAEQHSIRLNWPPVAGITQFEVEADGSVISVGASATFSHSGLAPNTRHTYRVRANNAGGTGNWSQPVVVFTLPDPPGIPANIQARPTQTEVTITWDSVARAESYDVEADGTVIEGDMQTKFVQSGLEAQSDHTYRVRAKNSGGVGEWSVPVTVQTLPYPPKTPEGLSSAVAIHEVTIQWKASEGATGYEVEADGLILNNEGATSFLHEGLLPLSGHTYRVRAVNAGGKSLWSAPLTVTTHPERPLKPTNVMTTAEQNTITVMWYQVAHAEDYEVEIDGAKIVTVSDSQFVHSGLNPETSHSYRIRARNISGYSDWTNPAAMATFPADAGETDMSLTNMAAVVTNRSITISWDTVARNAKYEIEVDGRMSDNGDNTIFHHGGLQAEEFHTYRIRLKQDDKPGIWVAVLSLSTLPDPPDAPENLSGFPANDSIELSWKRVDGATGYDLEVDGVMIDAGNLDTYNHQDLMPGTSHTYRLRAKNGTGVTAWSPALIASTTNPNYVVDVRAGQSFNLSLLAFNVQDFSELTYVVKYDPNQLEVVDLFQYTPTPDLTTSGSIPGSELEVTYEEGRVAYTFKHNIVPGTSWSGEVSTLVFKSKIDGQSTINVLVE